MTISSAHMQSLRTSLQKAGQAFLADRERWILWAPVSFGCGIGGYFALNHEPAVWLSLSIAGLLAVLLWRFRTVRYVNLLLVVLALGSFAFSYMGWRANFVAEPVIAKRMGPIEITGRVLNVEDFTKRRRVLLDRLDIPRLSRENQPARIRIRLLPGSDAEIGEKVRLKVILMPPSSPSLPGGFDFQRKAWFERIGGVGFAVSRMLARERAPPSGVSLFLQEARHAMATRIKTAIPGETGAVIAALIVGDRSGVSKETLQNLRDAGLAHLLAISGLYIGLVAATIFFAIRLGLACIEHCALKWPIKKIAAVFALFGSFIYLLIAGATVPTQRAFLMTGLVLIGVLVDRKAISLRLVAAAAMVVLLIKPESILGPSFQMSFAAVIALVAFYESLGPEIWRRFGEAGIVRKFLLYVTGLSLTTIIATVATGLIALHHFGRLPHFGLIGNLLAVPLTAIWIMPWAVLAVILMPFGLAFLALEPMGWGVDGVLFIAKLVAAWPNAVSLVPLMPMQGLVSTTLGGLWICFWTGSKRWLGMIGILGGVLSIIALEPPNILISGNGKLIAVRTPDGKLAFSSDRSEKFAAKLWLQANGQRRVVVFKDIAPSVLQCDGIGCLYRTSGREVALVWNERAFAEDCTKNRIVVGTVPLPKWCRSPTNIGKFQLWRNGAHAVQITPERVRIISVRDASGTRLWNQTLP